MLNIVKEVKIAVINSEIGYNLMVDAFRPKEVILCLTASLRPCCCPRNLIEPNLSLCFGNILM